LDTTPVRGDERQLTSTGFNEAPFGGATPVLPAPVAPRVINVPLNDMFRVR
jgi:hypothetical protein